MICSVPGADEQAVEGGLVAVELTAATVADDGAVVHVVGAAALVTVELEAVLLPRQGVAGAAVLLKTVGALAFIGDEHIVVAAGADDDAVVGAQDAGLLVLKVGGEGDVLEGTVVVAGGLQMSYAAVDASLDLTEVAGIAEYRRQLAGHGVELRVEKEVTAVLAVNGVFGIARNEEDRRR